MSMDNDAQSAVCRLQNDPLSPVLDQLFPGAHAHSGFVGQFRAVTDQATNDSYNIRCA